MVHRNSHSLLGFANILKRSIPISIGIGVIGGKIQTGASPRFPNPSSSTRAFRQLVSFREYRAVQLIRSHRGLAICFMRAIKASMEPSGVNCCPPLVHPNFQPPERAFSLLAWSHHFVLSSDGSSGFRGREWMRISGVWTSAKSGRHPRVQPHRMRSNHC
ncbi:hypothetical protein K493DRAFT_25733 [Basidiobolus meristosporus CBS 931.73]|uniref:Uncharacterized protein n=1 Tax=Basidiobolus meristosporus CBS 931.73 TaxID=1314790 RepID=A0A1Y1YBG8_9FUNG|nr:hypothetical protein K493DRAFT_25733 [Basidiobolus meristosporus CBS 931.73]|eukprot:ORX95292.1 hypothetical protein K493DRAFT_25733 [Basidiobolus meristosporus CBS 931.73]